MHEWPQEDEGVPFVLRLEFATDWLEQDHYYTRGTRVPTTRALGDCDMRYIVEAYAIDAAGNVADVATRRFIFSRAVLTEYDYETADVSLPEGSYKLVAWADFVSPGTQSDLYYNADSFKKIHYTDTADGYAANTDFLDAFRGTVQADFDATVYEVEAPVITIPMQRPLAKFTFVSNDLKEFIAKEETRVNRNNRNTKGDTDTKDASTKEGDTRAIDLNDYRVMFLYSGYLPVAYNLFSDRPNDVIPNETDTYHVQFWSKLTQLSDDEASMGFDYVLVNGSDASVEVTVGLFDADGNQISMSDPIYVPLSRSMHTIMRGSFMMMDADGGVGIDPGFDGDHNIEI